MSSYNLTELKYLLRQFVARWGRPAVQTGIAFGISVLAMVLWLSPTGQRMDLYVLRQFFLLRGERTAPEDVVIVGIDDDTYQKLGASPRWPFPRKFTAEAIDNIVKAGPKLLIVDANIPHEDQDAAADERLEAAIRSGPTTIWSGETPKWRAQDLEKDPAATITMASDNRFRAAAKMELPMLIGGTEEMSFRIALGGEDSAELYKMVPFARPLTELAHYKIDAPGLLDIINFYGPAGTIRRLSLYELVGPGSDAAMAKLKDKVVLFGYQSVGQGRGAMNKDEFFVPVSHNPMFGVEIHANIVGNLIDRSWLSRFEPTTELSMLYLTALVMGAIAVLLTPEKSVPLIAVMTGGCAAASYVLFSRYSIWVSGIGTLLAIAFVAALASAFFHYVLIRSFRDYIKRTFNFQMEREL